MYDADGAPERKLVCCMVPHLLFHFRLGSVDSDELGACISVRIFCQFEFWSRIFNVLVAFYGGAVLDFLCNRLDATYFFGGFVCHLLVGHMALVRADGRYILGLLFMSVVFSNEALPYVWWSPAISPAGRWILIFVPFFNVITRFLVLLKY